MAATPNPSARPNPEPPAQAAAAPAAGRGGGLKPWLPLLANLLLMPALAYATVNFLIVPKLHSGAANSGGASGASGHAAKADAAKAKVTVPLGGKILVNVAGTMGTRYLLASLTLVGTAPDLKEIVEKNDAQLRDAAAGSLCVKTIADLEKPGARNLVRTELISLFNNVLGEGMVSDIYLTEFAIQ